jgi:hypothetical protein
MHRLRRQLELWAGPRWPRPVRLSIALALVSLGYVCYRFHLTSPAGFLTIGVSIGLVLLFVRRALWKRSLRSGPPA